MNTNQVLRIIGRELFRLSEHARSVSNLCYTNAQLSSLSEMRLGFQRQALGQIEDAMVDLAGLLDELDRCMAEAERQDVNPPVSITAPQSPAEVEPASKPRRRRKAS
ncbi:MAG: hypothetical protein IPK69_11805 [Phycisphaerales bacterium]|nr:MAG: hypothetical protein IPK69_11805 [Phycisphaerales bacterium]